MASPEPASHDELHGWTLVGPQDGEIEEATREGHNGSVALAVQEDCKVAEGEAGQPSAPALDEGCTGEIVAAEGVEEHAFEPASPESERLADSVLAKPFCAQLNIPSPEVEPSAEQGEASPPKTPTREAAAHPADDLHHDTASHWRFDRNRVRAVSRLSGEGALEGFQDPADLPLADTPTGHYAQLEVLLEEACVDPSSGGAVSLGWEGLWSALWQDLEQEWGGMCAATRAAARAMWARLQAGTLTVQECAAMLQRKASKALGGSCPVWLLLSISSIATMALAALAAQLWRNRDLAAQLRHRDRDLARLIVKVLQLQDSLRNTMQSVPIVRHTSFMPGDRFASTTVTTMVGMV